MKAMTIVSACCLLCGCELLGLEGDVVTVTRYQNVVNAPGCKFVGNMDETAESGGPTATYSATEQVEIQMKGAVTTMGGNVLLLLSMQPIQSGGYGSSTEGTGAAYWCPVYH